MSEREPTDKRPSEFVGAIFDVLICIIIAITAGGVAGIVQWFSDVGAGPAFLIVGMFTMLLVAVVGHPLRRPDRS